MVSKKNIYLLILLLFLIALSAGLLTSEYLQGVLNLNITEFKEKSIPTNYIPSVAEARFNVEVILDISNSMWGQLQGVNKIVNSKGVLSIILKDLPQDVRLGLRTFGGDGEVRLEVPLGVNNRVEMERVISSLRPSGTSPIGYALESSAQELKKHEGRKFIILISDGLDTGKIDPVAKAKEIREMGIITHVVYIRGEGENNEKELLKVAEAGGGHFFTMDEKDLIVPTMTLIH